MRNDEQRDENNPDAELFRRVEQVREWSARAREKKAALISRDVEQQVVEQEWAWRRTHREAGRIAPAASIPRQTAPPVLQVRAPTPSPGRR